MAVLSWAIATALLVPTAYQPQGEYPFAVKVTGTGQADDSDSRSLLFG